jgi:phosphoribosylformimino-5-aminoimidazole carboxamide ribotide isomerase
MVNTDFRVIPVIDTMHGTALHAVRGQRENYRPLKSVLSATADPVEVAIGLREQFGFDEMYIADLDGITKGAADLSLITRLCGIKGLSIIVDSGANTSEEAERLREAGVAKIVIGSETLSNLDNVERVVDTIGSASVTGSIDVKNGEVHSRCRELRELKPMKVAQILENMGVGEIILLDISRVGSEMGVDTQIVEEVVEVVDIPLLVGGGVSSIDDIRLLKDAGASGVLVATALHRDRLTRFEMDMVRKWS